MSANEEVVMAAVNAISAHGMGSVRGKAGDPERHACICGLRFPSITRWAEHHAAATAVAVVEAARPSIRAEALREAAGYVEEAYTTEFFAEPTAEGAKRDNDLLREKHKSSVDKYSAAGARNVAKILRHFADDEGAS